MSAIRKFTLTIEDDDLRQRYLEENSRTIFKTGLFFTLVWVVIKTIILIGMIRIYDEV